MLFLSRSQGCSLSRQVQAFSLGVRKIRSALNHLGISDGCHDEGFRVKYVIVVSLKFLKFAETSFYLQSQDLWHTKTLSRVLGANL